MFFASWIAALAGGVVILGMSAVSNMAGFVYSRMLDGKPLPALTQMMIDAHCAAGENLPAVVLALVGAQAFVVWFLASRAADETSAIWIWLFLEGGTVFALAIYAVLGFVALWLPMVSTTSGMQVMADDEGRLFWRSIFTLAVHACSVLFAVTLAVLMWRRSGQGEAGSKFGPR